MLDLHCELALGACMLLPTGWGAVEHLLLRLLTCCRTIGSLVLLLRMTLSRGRLLWLPRRREGLLRP